MQPDELFHGLGTQRTPFIVKHKGIPTMLHAYSLEERPVRQNKIDRKVLSAVDRNSLSYHVMLMLMLTEKSRRPAQLSRADYFLSFGEV